VFVTHTCPEQLQHAWHAFERPVESADIGSSIYPIPMTNGEAACNASENELARARGGTSTTGSQILRTLCQFVGAMRW
jgi:hypothetical protein